MIKAENSRKNPEKFPKFSQKPDKFPENSLKNLRPVALEGSGLARYGVFPKFFHMGGILTIPPMHSLYLYSIMFQGLLIRRGYRVLQILVKKLS